MTRNVQHGIRALILTGWNHSPNGGISSKVDVVTIVGGHVPEQSPATADAPAVMFDETTPGYLVLRPSDEPGPGRTQYMASGAYVAPTDFETWKRVFGHHLPVPLHDRTETWAQYDALTC